MSDSSDPESPKIQIVWQDLTDEEIHEIRSKPSYTTEEELQLLRSALHRAWKFRKRTKPDSPTKGYYSCSQSYLDYFEPSPPPSPVRRSKTTEEKSSAKMNEEDELTILYRRCVEAYNCESLKADLHGVQRSYTTPASSPARKTLHLSSRDDSPLNDCKYLHDSQDSVVNHCLRRDQLPRVCGTPSSTKQANTSSLWGDDSYLEDPAVLEKIDTIERNSQREKPLSEKRATQTRNVEQSSLQRSNDSGEIADDGLNDEELLACAEVITSQMSKGGSSKTVDGHSAAKRPPVAANKQKTKGRPCSPGEIERKRQIALAKLRRSRTVEGPAPCDDAVEQVKKTRTTSEIIEEKRRAALKLRQEKMRANKEKQRTRFQEETNSKPFDKLAWNY